MPLVIGAVLAAVSIGTAVAGAFGRKQQGDAAERRADIDLLARADFLDDDATRILRESRYFTADALARYGDTVRATTLATVQAQQQRLFDRATTASALADATDRRDDVLSAQRAGAAGSGLALTSGSVRALLRETTTRSATESAMIRRQDRQNLHAFRGTLTALDERLRQARGQTGRALLTSQYRTGQAVRSRRREAGRLRGIADESGSAGRNLALAGDLFAASAPLFDYFDTRAT